MSEVHIYLICLLGSAAVRPSSSPSPSPRFVAFLLSRRAVFFLAGDLTQWHLPVGMKDLDLWGTEVTGKAKLIKRVTV